MAYDFDGNLYGANNDGADASIGNNTQINPAFFWKKALLELVKERYFGQLADVKSMPKNHGKKIIRHHYLPLLDDANTNDQGIDAAGATTLNEVTIKIVTPAGMRSYVVASGADAAAALAAAKVKALVVFASYGVDTTNVLYDTYDEAKAAYFNGAASTVADKGQATENAAVDAHGNLYGSSKDVGYISGKLPALTETGGRVNRVGYTRRTLEGTFEKFGFFDEYTQESMDFDTDDELEMHIVRETLRGANELTEDALQIDLLSSAGVIRFSGDATSDAEMSAEGTKDEVNYDDLMRLGIDLDNNRCPKRLTMITGTRLIDTKTIDGARPLYIGSEVLPILRKMADSFGDRAFIPVHQYAAGGTTIPGEVGSIDQFRIVVVPEMMRWEGAGDAVGTNPGYRETGGNYDVYPMLCVGEGSFTTIGFQTDGKTVKFKIKHAKPGSTESYAGDPYGETGFYSIKWYYGFMILRPEWLAIVKTVAPV